MDAMRRAAARRQRERVGDFVRRAARTESKRVLGPNAQIVVSAQAMDEIQAAIAHPRRAERGMGARFREPRDAYRFVILAPMPPTARSTEILPNTIVLRYDVLILPCALLRQLASPRMKMLQPHPLSIAVPRPQSPRPCLRGTCRSGSAVAGVPYATRLRRCGGRGVQCTQIALHTRAT